MSTRSVTRIETDLGTKEIYRHSDGYPISTYSEGMVEELQKNLWRINEEVELTKRIVNEDNLNSDERDLVIKNMWRKISYIVRDETLNWIREYENNESYRGDKTFTTYSDLCIEDEGDCDSVMIDWYYNINLTNKLKVLDVRRCISIYKGGGSSFTDLGEEYIQEWMDGYKKYMERYDTDNIDEINKLKKEYGEKFFEPNSYENTNDYKSFPLLQRVIFEESNDKYSNRIETLELLEDMWDYSSISELYRNGDLEEWKSLTDDVLNQPINDTMVLEDFKTIPVDDFIQYVIKEKERINNLLEENEIETIKD
jgi:hypothetical protein